MNTFHIVWLNSVCLWTYLIFIRDVIGVLKPRGVPMSRSVFYNPKDNFNCLDGSGVFPFNFVNDDFCDCKDGSDEPGTSACADSVFICPNHGYLPVVLPSSRVNDGVCDCCDTSDEYDSKVDCIQNCKKLALEAIESAKVVYSEYVKGNETRMTYIMVAHAKKEKYMSTLDALIAEESLALKTKLEMEDAKEIAEEMESVVLERQKIYKKEQEEKRQMKLRHLKEQNEQEEYKAKEVFSELDRNGDGIIVSSEIMSFARFDYDQDGKVSEKEAQFYMNKKDKIDLNDFLMTGWRSMKPAFLIEEEEAEYELHDVNLHDISEKDRNTVFENAAIGRKDFANANQVLQDIQVEIWNVKKILNTDYGPEDEFLALHFDCFEFSDKRYLYKVCLFDKIIQIMKHNRDEVLIGAWNNWSGPEHNRYSEMSYTKGDACWNGPPRSAVVKLTCGVENKIVSLTESSPCVYIFVMSTAASCKDLPTQIQKVLNINIINL